MALGLVRQLASGQHMQVRIPSGNYLWPTIRVLNPNDGVVYVKQNADLTDIGFGSWDYKIPSQSFGLLPGEGEGWQSVGMYYLDQSGANRPGEISIYLTQQSATEPTFQSIGRAAVTLSSSVDVASGNVPANPPAGYGRLWVDTAGHLNVLQPTGTNYLEYDNTNIGTVTLGGDLYGTIGAAHINVQYNNYIELTYSNATTQRVIQPVNNDSYFFTGNSGRMYFWSDNPATNLGYWDSPTNQLVVTGNLTANQMLSNNSLFLGRAAQGYIYFENTNAVWMAYNTPTAGYINVNYPFYCQSTFVTAGTIDNGGGLMYFDHNSGIYFSYNASGGYFSLTPQPLLLQGTVIYFNNSTATYLNYIPGGPYFNMTSSLMLQGATLYFNGGATYWSIGGGNTMTCPTNVNAASFIAGSSVLDGNNLQLGGANSRIYLHPNQTVYVYQNYPYATWQNLGLSFAATPGNAYAVITQNVGGTAGSMMAVAYNLWSSVEHAREYGIKNVKVPDPLALVKSVTGYYYDHISFDEETPRRNQDGTLESTPLYGFSALEVSQAIPELSTGTGVDNGRMVTILWEAVKELDTRLSKLEPVV